MAHLKRQRELYDHVVLKVLMQGSHFAKGQLCGTTLALKKCNVVPLCFNLPYGKPTVLRELLIAGFVWQLPLSTEPSS